MRDHSHYDYAVVRVVPRVEREEFVNVGVIVSCPDKNFLDARIFIDEHRLRALDPTLDIAAIRAHTDSIRAICAGGEKAGPLGRLSQRERFHWMVAPRSTIIQTSPAHAGKCEDPEKLIEHLLQKMVLPQAVR
jgi:hypothetical protein